MTEQLTDKDKWQIMLWVSAGILIAAIIMGAYWLGYENGYTYVVEYYQNHPSEGTFEQKTLPFTSNNTFKGGSSFINNISIVEIE